MDKIIVFKLTEITNYNDDLNIGIPLSKIKEIKEVPNCNFCIINGHEIQETFKEVINRINKEYMENNYRSNTSIYPILDDVLTLSDSDQ